MRESGRYGDHPSCFAATRNIVASGHKSTKSRITRHVVKHVESAAIHAQSDRGRLVVVCDEQSRAEYPLFHSQFIAGKLREEARGVPAADQMA